MESLSTSHQSSTLALEELVTLADLQPEPSRQMVPEEMPEPPESASPAVAETTSKGLSVDRAEVRIFFSTFLTIFLAELGDKTQLTTLLMSAESHAPWVVFTGAGLALITTSLLGVWLGCWLARRIAPRVLETAAGILLLGIAFLLLWDIIQL
ncbi:MAG TPA: TMEM165/GDT1 family protein [Allocoleopsis sp.]